MSPIKTSQDIEKMREAGKMAAIVLDHMINAIQPNMTTYELDQIGYACMKANGVTSASYNYPGTKCLFPGYTCISINEELVHGVPSKTKFIKEGDIVSIDVATFCNGYVGDNAKTVAVGKINKNVENLLNTTERALFAGIEQAIDGNFVGDISNAIQRCVESQNYSVSRDFVGHGVGKKMHEDPAIPNYGRPKQGMKLRAGMTLAIETMVNMGDWKIEVSSDDGWTVSTKDKKMSAHFEHTILVGKNFAEILTKC